MQLRFGVGDDETLLKDECHDDPNRECTPAESKAKNLVLWIVMITTSKFVQFEDIALEAVTECAANDCRGLE